MPSRESDLDRDGLLGTYLKLSTACRTLSNRENDFDGESDGDLWSQVSTHNGAAFAELFERHSKSVYNHCFRLTGSWSAAEDLTSVVFLQAGDDEIRSGFTATRSFPGCWRSRTTPREL